MPKVERDERQQRNEDDPDARDDERSQIDPLGPRPTLSVLEAPDRDATCGSPAFGIRVRGYNVPVAA